MIQRYRLGLDTRTEGSIFKRCEIVKYTDHDVWIREQKHKKGGWCRYEEVKHLEAEVARLRDALKEIEEVENSNWALGEIRQIVRNLKLS
jgi:hypothetical protein